MTASRHGDAFSLFFVDSCHFFVRLSASPPLFSGIKDYRCFPRSRAVRTCKARLNFVCNWQIFCFYFVTPPN